MTAPPDSSDEHGPADQHNRSAAWMVANSDRPDDDPPHEARMLDDLVQLYLWASACGVRVHLVSSDVDGRHIYAAHCGAQSRVATGPPRPRTWSLSGFQT